MTLRYTAGVFLRLLLLQSAVLAVLLTWPAPIRFWSEAVGTLEGDGLKHVWNLWWMRAELFDGAPGIRTLFVNYPFGMDLFPIEPLNGILSFLIPLPPVPLSNLLALLNVALVGVCAGWLGRLVTGHDRAALAAAALMQGSSFVAFTLHVGVGELREVWWIPLGLGCLLEARRTLDWRWFLALGGALALSTLSCFYHGFFLATSVAVVALATLRPAPRLLGGYVLAAGLSLAIVVPVIKTFSQSYAPAEQRRETSFAAWMGARFEPESFRGASLELDQLVSPRRTLREGAERQLYAYGGGRYVGVLAILLALAGVVAAPRLAAPWVLMTATGVVLAMGTVLWVDGEPASPRVILPLTWINRALQFYAEPLNFPSRYIVVASAGFAVLGALAVRRWPALVWVVPFALVDVALNDLVPWPRDTFALPDTRGLKAPTGAVADMTPMTRSGGKHPDAVGDNGASVSGWIDAQSRARAISAQIEVGRPISTVPIERAEMWALEGLHWTAVSPLASALAGHPATDDDLRRSVWALRDRGFGSVLVTHSCDVRVEARPSAVLDPLCGPPARSACATVWTLPDLTPPGDPDEARRALDAAAAKLVAPRMGPANPPPPR